MFNLACPRLYHSPRIAYSDGENFLSSWHESGDGIYLIALNNVQPPALQ